MKREGNNMALKALVLKKRLNEKKEQLEELRRAAEQLQTREAELEQSINEAETDEEKAAVEEAVEQFEQESWRARSKELKPRSRNWPETHLSPKIQKNERRILIWKPEPFLAWMHSGAMLSWPGRM